MMKSNKLMAILIISVLLRIGAALYLGNEVVSLPGTADQVSYHHLALRVLDGHGFTFGEPWWPATAADAPTAHWSYLYTLFLAAVYALFGPVPIMARLIQAVAVGLLQPILAYRLATQVLRSLAPSDMESDSRGTGGPATVERGYRPEALREFVPLIAAAITAVYVYFVYYAATLMTESFYIVGILAALSLAVSLVRRIGDNRLAVVLGLALAATVLLRQLFLLFAPFLFLWIAVAVHHRRRWTQSIRPLAISTGVIILLILPATIFNYTRFQRFVLLNTNAGYAFFWANHPVYEDSFIPASEMSGTYQELIPTELQGLDEAALDQALLKRGLQFVIEEPARYARLSMSRIPEYFKFWPEASSGRVSNVSRVLSFGLFLPFMIVGLVLSLIDLARRARTSIVDAAAAPTTLLLLFVTIYAAIHILSWSQVRYRLPVDAILILFAAAAIAELAGRILSFRQVTAPEAGVQS